MPRRINAPLLALSLLSLATPAAAQHLLGAADLATLTAPPPDHRIAYGPAPLQFGNLRLPHTQGPHPVVVFVHGGCWSSRYDIAHAAALEQAIADSGFAVWSIEYRRVGDEGGGWPGTFNDVAHATDHLRVLAPQYSLDLDRVIVSGHSAGGQFALWLAARKKIPAGSDLYIANPLPVRGVLALAPAPDLEGLFTTGECGKSVDGLMGGSPADHPDRYAAGSPTRLVPIGVRQVVIVAAHDQTFGPGGRAYVARAKAAGDSMVRLVEAPDAGHFEVIAPKTSTWALVMAAIRELAAEK